YADPVSEGPDGPTPTQSRQGPDGPKSGHTDDPISTSTLSRHERRERPLAGTGLVMSRYATRAEVSPYDAVAWEKRLALMMVRMGGPSSSSARWNSRSSGRS